MRRLLLFLYTLPFSVEAANPSHRYAWGDFTHFNQTEQTSGLSMSSDSPSLVLDSNGHIVLNQNTVKFNFERTPIRPNLSDSNAFCLGLTFETGSFSSANSSLSYLFSGKFYENGNDFLDMNVSYNGDQLGGVSFNSGEMSQITTRIDPSRDLTLFISQIIYLSSSPLTP